MQTANFPKAWLNVDVVLVLQRPAAVPVSDGQGGQALGFQYSTETGRITAVHDGGWVEFKGKDDALPSLVSLAGVHKILRRTDIALPRGGILAS